MKINPPKIGIVTFPVSQAGVIPLSNLVNIFCSIVEEVHVVTGGDGFTAFKNNKKVHPYLVEHNSGHTLISRIFKYVQTQIRISNKLFKLRKDVNCWVFFIGAEGLVIPILTAKLLRKKVVVASAGTGFKPAKAANTDFAFFLGLLQTCTYYLANKIVLYSKGFVEQQSLGKYKNKIFIAHEHFLDFDLFKNQCQLNDRAFLVGYIGRLSEEKGAFNFVKAISAILAERNESICFIGGDGQLKDNIEKYLLENNLNKKVKFAGWISHEKLPQYLNDIKLVVIPSYYEGLPNIMLEAMACGTLVLATPVGAIPDFIKDSETGFIMEDNSPGCIATNIKRALNHPDIKQIENNAMTLVKKEFTYGNAVLKYRELFDKLCS